MSRRASHISLHGPRHVLELALVLALGLAAVWSVPTAAQEDRQSLQHEWQVVSYRVEGATPPLQAVPAGISATLLLSVGGQAALGDAACSSYQTTYNAQATNLEIDSIEPAFVECDPASREFDDTFYDLLEATTSFRLTGSMLILRDDSLNQLMVLTRARIDDDPTVARWDLARIGAADGSIEPVIAGLNPWVEFLPGGSLVGQIPSCGSVLGKYSTNEGTVDIRDVHYRLECGSDAAQAQADKIIASLGEISRFDVLPAGLRLKDAAGVVRLAFAPVLDLDRRIWTPTVIYDGAGGIVRDENLSTSAIKLDGRTANGGTICRPFTANGIRSGLALNIVNIDYGEATPCKEPKKETAVDQPAVEKAFTDALKATASHALRGSELEFKDVDGDRLMLLEPQAELIGPTWVVQKLGRDRQDVTGQPPTVTFTDFDTVFGDTGVVRQGTGMVNTFDAFFSTPQATRLNVERIEYSNYCKKRAKTKECKQEELFLDLLGQADIYRATETDLRLYRGTDPIMVLVPQYTTTSEG